MKKLLLIALLLAGVLCSSQPCGSSAGQAKAGGDVATSPPAPAAGPIKVSITTGGGLYGPVKSRFKVGEEIPVVISLTNTGAEPAKYCRSTLLIQNRPQLWKDGKLLPYSTNLTKLADAEDTIRRCESSAARQFYVLQPKEKSVVDWFTIGTRGIVWYAPLEAGRYELVLQRRIECCQGPLLESDKISFDVVP